MPLRIAHVTASPNFGGVERLILEIGRSFQRTKNAEQIFASFPENGNAEPFLREVTIAGFTAYRFQNDTPHLIAATFEMIHMLKQHQIQILCAHGHKARMLGWFAAKRLRIPIVGISHGWTGEDRKVKLYDRIDKWMHRRMNHIVCVSQGQADKVIRYGTPADRVSVIYNAVRMERFDMPSNIAFRHDLEKVFPTKPKLIVGAAGRLSPEKGFDILITAAGQLLKGNHPAAVRHPSKGGELRNSPPLERGHFAAQNAGVVSLRTGHQQELRNMSDIGFVIFGDGVLREPLQKQIDELGIASSVVLPGFTDQLDQYMHHFDLFVQSSHTEGMPSVLLEAMAARTAVVATQVGGTGELVVEGSTGLIVPPNDPQALADAMRKMLSDDDLRRTMGENGRRRVEQSFSFEPQAEAYWNLFCRLLEK